MNEHVQECETCQATLTEGYTAEWCALSFCSIECAKQKLAPSDVEEGLEDSSFFWTEFVQFAHIENKTSEPMTLEVFTIHDNVYLSQEMAEQFNDGKDSVKSYFLNLEPSEIFWEGIQAQHTLYKELQHALQAIHDN